MKPFYFLEEKSFIISAADAPQAVSLVHLLRDKAELSREDRFILEKHSHDIFKMLLRHLFAIDAFTQILPHEQHKAERLLAEYLEVRALLSRD